MARLSDEQQEEMSKWVLHEVTEFGCPRPDVLTNYIRALVRRSATQESMVGLLKVFLKDNAESFVERLFDVIDKGDFSFTETNEVPEAKPVPPPQPKPEQKPKKNDTDKPAPTKPSTETKQTKAPEKSKEKILLQLQSYDSSSDEEDIQGPIITDAPRYVIYIAGLQDTQNTIGQIYKNFNKYGLIIGIEEMKDKKAALIEYDTLEAAFRAIHAKKKFWNNEYLELGFAVPPNPEKLKHLQDEYDEKKRKREELRQQEEQSRNVEILSKRLDKLSERLQEATTEEDKAQLAIEIEQVKEQINKLIPID